MTTANYCVILVCFSSVLCHTYLDKYKEGTGHQLEVFFKIIEKRGKNSINKVN